MDSDNGLQMAPALGGLSFYDWEVQTGEFTMDDYAGVLGAAAAGVTLKRKAWEALIHEDDKKKATEAVQVYLSRKDPNMELEYRVRAPSDGYRWFIDRGSIVDRSKRGKPKRIRGVLVDITQRKETEEMVQDRSRVALAAARTSENEKWAILEGLRGLVRVRYLARDFRIIWTNADVIEGLNAEHRTTSPVYCYELVHGQKRPCLKCEAREALETGQIWEDEESRPADGQCFIARGIPVRDGSGAIQGVLHIALNITKHKQTEEGLKTTNEFLHSLLENSPAPICVSHRDGRIDTVNQAWEKTLGYTRNHVVGRSFHDIFGAEEAEPISRMHGQILASNSSIEVEESIDCPTGLHHFHTVRFPLQNATGETAAVGAISIDVTARKRAEQELTRSEAELREKTAQLGEMNTALRVLLRQREEDQKELEERFTFNVKELVLPYVRKLKGMHLNETQMSFVEIVETHLNDIIAPFLRQVVAHYPGITAKELQVATLVREGKTNKEIANLMNLSLNTIEIHRYNVRKKLGLQNKKMNLRSYLLSLNKFTQ